MKVSARTRANRRNARLSTGPKSSEGKARVAQNARRHGLAVPVERDPILRDRVEALARLIAGSGHTPEILELATQIAESEIDILRIRQARKLILDDPKLRFSSVKLELRNGHATFNGQSIDHETYLEALAGRLPQELVPRLTEAIGNLASMLARCDRYERRAMSRRKAALRDLQIYDLSKEPRIIP